ncbi:basic secretory protein-like protein [Candidatus Uabimicrobium sp. HlEnr_7]|uniref:basic secretory protein-like protein n=1 Tax=Candidatus Uabimicrobium helgolandensis TaxID=3095367 RepID=UPI003559254B
MKSCGFCKQKITGKFWQSRNNYFCTKCYQKSKKCNHCGLPARRGIKRGSKIYCSICTSKAKRCKHCNKHIFQKYWQVDQAVLCSGCYNKMPKCFRCKRTTKDYLQIQSQILCVPCSNTVELCAKCHVPLIAKFFTFPNDKRKFCNNCVNSKNYCDTCSTPITGKYYQIGDKRNICGICMKTSVQNPTAAKKILHRVVQFVEKKFNMKINLATELELVDALTLAKLRTKNTIKYGASDRRALGLFVQRGNNYRVYIESLLPYSLCMGVLAHEYTHAWQADHFHKKPSLLILEGLAEWISYKTLIHYNYKTEAQRIEKQRDIYGQGFRKIRNFEKKYGEKNILGKMTNLVNK